MYSDDYLEQEAMDCPSEEELFREATRRLLTICDAYRLSSRIMENWKNGLVSCSSTTVHGEVASARHTAPYDLPHGVRSAIMTHIPLNSQLQEVVREFEEEHGVKVYYVLQNLFFLTMLYVSPYQDEWELFDEEEMLEGYFEAYVHNLISPDKSEVGFVRLCSVDGVLLRILG